MDVSTAQAYRPLLGVLDVTSDALRAGVLASAIFGAIFLSWGAFVTFLVILAIVLVPRIAALPRPADLAVCITWLVATWANVLGWYGAAKWIDLTIHFFTTGANAAMIYLLLVRIAAVPPLHDRSIRRRALVVLTVAIGMGIGVLWEFYEWVAYAALADKLYLVGYADTIGDLLVDSGGSLLAGLAIALWASMGWGTRRLSLHRVR